MKKKALDYATVAAGAFLLALSVRFFLVPVKISTGGISGIAIVLYYLAEIPLFFTTLVLNLFLFLMGFRLLARSAIVKNLMGIVLFSVFLHVLGFFSLSVEDRFLASVFGGALAGVGVGIALRKDASTGGTDFAALMLSKRFPHLSPSFFITVIDTGIILLSGIAYEDVATTLYSLLSLFISNFVVDQILVRGGYAKKVTVISEQCDRIAQRIQTELERGVTGVYIRMYYRKKDGRMAFCVLKNRQVPHLIALIQEEDPNAFTVISDVKRVHGEGFSA